MRRAVMLSVVVGVTLVVAVVGPAAPHEGHDVPRVTVGKDPAGDWGKNIHAALADAGRSAGQDLVAASIARPAPDRLAFTLRFAALPEDPRVLEQAIYRWSFGVDGEAWFLTSSPSDCLGSEQSSTCASMQTDGLSFALQNEEHHRVVVAVLPAAVDTTERTIEVEIADEMLGAKAGSRITRSPLTSTSVRATTSLDANVLDYRTPYDVMRIRKSFIVPGNG